jgi:hypothetical protein
MFDGRRGDEGKCFPRSWLAVGSWRISFCSIDYFLTPGRLQEELRVYSPDLVGKPALVVANKIDRLRREGPTLEAIRRRTGLEVVGICALPGVPGHSPAAIQVRMDLDKGTSFWC